MIEIPLSFLISGWLVFCVATMLYMVTFSKVPSGVRMRTHIWTQFTKGVMIICAVAAALIILGITGVIKAG